VLSCQETWHPELGPNRKWAVRVPTFSVSLLYNRYALALNEVNGLLWENNDTIMGMIHALGPKRGSGDDDKLSNKVTRSQKDRYPDMYKSRSRSRESHYTIINQVGGLTLQETNPKQYQWQRSCIPYLPLAVETGTNRFASISSNRQESIRISTAGGGPFSLLLKIVTLAAGLSPGRPWLLSLAFSCPQKDGLISFPKEAKLF
jgi:hypothetical protein